MEGEDVYMWARCSRMFEDDICCVVFWYLTLYRYVGTTDLTSAFCFELGVPHLYFSSNKMMFLVYVF